MSTPDMEGRATTMLLVAMRFAAQKHCSHRRKDSETPYINHLIAVAELLARVGKVIDISILQAAILHDSIEDTRTAPGEIEEQFGREVRLLVQEVTDDKSLPKDVRKRLQIEHAPHLSPGAKQIKIVDKIDNIADMPASWPVQRREEYLDWAEKVVAGCRGCNVPLEQQFDAVLSQQRKILHSST
jgi:guanosine-3',5'-bis(diphosphate) 3'-pyrophosphohydrolase